jgi:hypothetical protein
VVEVALEQNLGLHAPGWLVAATFAVAVDPSKACTAL